MLPSRRVMTMEWINGVKLTTLPAEEIRSLVKVGQQAFLIQLLEIGFFHGDPHPGNLLKITEGKRDGGSGLWGLRSSLELALFHLILNYKYPVSALRLLAVRHIKIILGTCLFWDRFVWVHCLLAHDTLCQPLFLPSCH